MTYKSNLFAKAGPMRCKQVIQSFIQSGPKNFQEWRRHSLSGECLAVPDGPQIEIVSFPSSMCCWKELHLFSFLLHLLEVIERLHLGSPKAVSSPGSTNSIPLASPPTANDPAVLIILVALWSISDCMADSKVVSVPQHDLTGLGWREKTLVLNWLCSLQHSSLQQWILQISFLCRQRTVLGVWQGFYKTLHCSCSTNNNVQPVKL